MDAQGKDPNAAYLVLNDNKLQRSHEVKLMLFSLSVYESFVFKILAVESSEDYFTTILSMNTKRNNAGDSHHDIMGIRQTQWKYWFKAPQKISQRKKVYLHEL